MASILLIRPGSTEYDHQHRIQGTLDLPLSPKGEEQVERLVELLSGLPLEVLYYGPCESARNTAQPIAEKLGINAVELKSLCNLNQGLWQGLSVEELRHKYTTSYKQWQEKPEMICPPEGEQVSEAQQRIQKSVNKIAKGKQPCGVIVPEPLASLVACSLKGCDLEFASPSYPENERDLIQIVRDDENNFADTSFQTPSLSR